MSRVPPIVIRRTSAWLFTSLLAGACARQSPPPPPPSTPLRQARPPATSPAPSWEPQTDLQSLIVLQRWEARANEAVDRYGALEAGDPEGIELLVEALECFEKTGHPRQAIEVIIVFREDYPEQAEAEDLEVRLREQYELLVDEERGRETPHARVCGVDQFEPPRHASAGALVGIATCLQDTTSLDGVELRYRTLADERVADAKNRARIEELEARIAEIERKLREP